MTKSRARWITRLFPQVPDFYGMLDEQCDLAVSAMNAFVAFMQDSDPARGREVRDLEHRGDTLKHRNMDVLNRSFATPMDREDIFRAIVTIDDVISYAKTTVREMEILDVAPDVPMREMASLLLAGTLALRQGYAKLRSRPLDAEADAQRAHKTERETEKVYRRAVAELFDEQRLSRLVESAGDRGAAGIIAVVRMLRRRELYRHLSNAADRIEVASEALRDIIVKIS